MHHHDYLITQRTRLYVPGYNWDLGGSSSCQAAREASSREEDDEFIAVMRPAVTAGHKQRRWDEKEEAVIYYNGILKGAILRADHSELLQCIWQNNEGQQKTTLEARKQCLEPEEDRETDAFVIHEVRKSQWPGFFLTLDLQGNILLQQPPDDMEGSQVDAVALRGQLNRFLIFATWIIMKVRKLV